VRGQLYWLSKDCKMSERSSAMKKAFDQLYGGFVGDRVDPAEEDNDNPGEGDEAFNQLYGCNDNPGLAVSDAIDDDEEVFVRIEIARLSCDMQKQMNEHAHSHGEGWCDMPLSDLLVHLLKDLGELAFHVRTANYPHGTLSHADEPDYALPLDDIEEKTADIANECWMIRERCRKMVEHNATMEKIYAHAREVSEALRANAIRAGLYPKTSTKIEEEETEAILAHAKEVSEALRVNRTGIRSATLPDAEPESGTYLPFITDTGTDASDRLKTAGYKCERCGHIGTTSVCEMCSREDVLARRLEQYTESHNVPYHTVTAKGIEEHEIILNDKMPETMIVAATEEGIAMIDNLAIDLSDADVDELRSIVSLNDNPVFPGLNEVPVSDMEYCLSEWGKDLRECVDKALTADSSAYVEIRNGEISAMVNDNPLDSQETDDDASD